MAAHERPDAQALFGIVQGGTDLELRRHCAQVLSELDLPGYALRAYTGSFGMTGMTDPLDIVQDPSTGNLYVVEAGFRVDGGNPAGLKEAGRPGK